MGPGVVLRTPQHLHFQPTPVRQHLYFLEKLRLAKPVWKSDLTGLRSGVELPHQFYPLLRSQ